MLVTLFMTIIFISGLCFQVAILLAARQGRDTERMIVKTMQQMSRFQPEGKHLIKFMFHKSAGF